MLTFADGTFASIDCSWSKPLNYPTWGGLTMELISERVHRRRESGQWEHDMLQVYMDATYQDGRKLTDHEITGMVICRTPATAASKRGMPSLNL